MQGCAFRLYCWLLPCFRVPPLPPPLPDLCNWCWPASHLGSDLPSLLSPTRQNRLLQFLEPCWPDELIQVKFNEPVCAGPEAFILPATCDSNSIIRTLGNSASLPEANNSGFESKSSNQAFSVWCSSCYITVPCKGCFQNTWIRIKIWWEKLRFQNGGRAWGGHCKGGLR